MPESMTIAIITLIFKKGDSEMLKSYRPISHTNYDYKILAYLLKCLCIKSWVNSNILYVKDLFDENGVFL